MTWFKVDDQLHDHKKFRKLGDDRLAACGLWTHCGSWAGRNLSDGFVPLEVVLRWDPKTRLAGRLVEVGLWVTAEIDGERGYLFHEWEDHQPTRADVEKRREETRERVRRYREARALERAQNADNGSATNDVSNHGSNAVTDAEPDASRNADVPDPKGSRPEPDPSRTSYGSTREGRASRRTPETPLPDAWAPDPSHHRLAQELGVDVAGQADAFRDHAKANDRRQRDWGASFRTWLRKAPAFAAGGRNGGRTGHLAAVPPHDDLGWAQVPDNELPIDRILGPDPTPAELPTERKYRDDVEAYNSELARRRRERREQRQADARQRLERGETWGLR